ncbi:MAG: hypothetical protein KKC42_04060 [Candidatus Omnitrophica bacterium]|nr:hypothetical protein [Candidatus Omnitrophota bacterium]
MRKFFSFYPYFIKDNLSNFIVLAIALFTVLTLIYSSKFMKGKKGLLRYYTYIILTSIASIAAVRSNHLILLFVFWGFLGLTLYLLINMGENASEVAKKTFIIIGGSDALMLLGIGIIYYLSGTFMMDKIRIPLASNSILPIVAYLCIAIGCFAKAGVMPFHTWIPDSSEAAPLPVVAFLPASLDKLLGIYLLARISMDLFIMIPLINMILMVVGAFTIIAGVMMALVQHNMKRLLGYHAVSQVGYMVLGIGTGTPIGIAGGLFHMLNNAIYKQALFFSAGNVESRTGTTELDKIGGLSKVMPLTYIAALIACLSISGVPPFNGFVSKWMVYQGVISQLQFHTDKLRFIGVLCLAAAMFGSGLTLASFMKLIHAAFLGQREVSSRSNIKEVSIAMWLPGIILAIICIVFGVFANQVPLKQFILPAVSGVSFIGTWYSGLATTLIIAGLVLGILIFKLKNLAPNIREDKSYIGAEPLDLENNRVTGTEFYNTIKELKTLKPIYKRVKKGTFDIYEQGKKFTFSVAKVLQYLHNGVLPTYMVWCLLGTLALFYYLLFK